MTIDILCKVVDNFGDIGVVYRLAKALSDADPEVRLRLVVDDLASFKALVPDIDPGRDVQTLRGWTVVRWDFPYEGFVREPPLLVLECFACGRPEFFESCLFDPGRCDIRHIVNVEYLSAEPYADELHRMPSLTRSSEVKKHIFMPGFTPDTGGLVMDRDFIRECERWKNRSALPALRTDLAQRAKLPLETGQDKRFWTLVFCYEHDFTRIVDDLARLNADKPLIALLAHGKSERCFRDAWTRAGSPFPIVQLPFLPQELWDETLLACDFSIVRGEESLARASLSGRPFLWHAYLQDEKHQLVKVQALLDRMRPHFRPEAFRHLEDAFLAFNDRSEDHGASHGGESLAGLLSFNDEENAGFARFSETLSENGDMALHLLTFLRSLV